MNFERPVPLSKFYDHLCSFDPSDWELNHCKSVDEMSTIHMSVNGVLLEVLCEFDNIEAVRLDGLKLSLTEENKKKLHDTFGDVFHDLILQRGADRMSLLAASMNKIISPVQE